ncbi:MAG: non-homologous end-joining DNA ligase [Candidatus Rokubacteria bacterium]|nr:non-homologous end-joining DNA ligase [Candidatus Rokubacteria bacterium]
MGGHLGALPSSNKPARIFVIQKHAARRLHYDLRLEIGGTLKSWAVPKGPSVIHGERRLAVHVEDHPVEYAEFEGVIPRDNYGAGEAIVWDRGWCRSAKPESLEAQLARGRIEFELFGVKLRGRWTLVRTAKGRDWLLLKADDAWAGGEEPTRRFPESVLSGLTVEELRGAPARLAPLRTRLQALRAPVADVDARAQPVMLATLAEQSFSRPGWLFEAKYDGVRVLAERAGGTVELYGRAGQRFTPRYPEVVAALRALPLDRFLLDGEVVALDERGRPSFQRLQLRMHLTHAADVERARGATPVTGVFFDALAIDGRDLRALPLGARKECLALLVPARGVIHYGAHVEEHGEAFYEAASEQRIEGIVAKNARSRYTGGRTGDWVKIKCHQRQEFVIGGYTAPQGSRPRFGALHVGVYDGDTLVYVGRVGTGFDDRTLEAIFRQLQPLRRATSPFRRGTPKGRGHTWVEPTLVCDVRFTEWTADGGIRHPAFLGLRADVRAVAVRREVAVVGEVGGPGGRGGTAPPGSVGSGLRPLPTANVGAAPPRPPGPPTSPTPATSDQPPLRARRNARRGTPAATRNARATDPSAVADSASSDRAVADSAASGKRASAETARVVQLSNVGKVFWPREKYTKGDLLAYYDTVAPLMLPYLRDRPLVLTRYPDGIGGTSFYQKDAPHFAPSWIRTVRIDAPDAGRAIDYLVVDDALSLRYVVNLGAIPLHLWGARVATLSRPDWLVLDLDPKGAPFTDVVRVALSLRAILAELRLVSYVKTSGATGLHILLPLGARYTWEETRTFARLLATLGVEAEPRIATIERQIRARQGKVYIDWLQNVQGQTIVAPFSVRPLPGAPVSCPLRWDEVTPRLDPSRFTIVTVPKRFAGMKDPVAPVLRGTIDIAAALRRLARRL